MSIDMYLEDSQSQGSSAWEMAKKEIKVYGQIEDSLSEFEASNEALKGQAYDSARAYSLAVIRPLARGGKLLAETVGTAAKRFPQAYTEQVANESLKESELIANIQTLENQIQKLNNNIALLSEQKSTAGSADRIKSYQGVANLVTIFKSQLEEKLEKLRNFHRTSPQIFSEIASLQALVQQGLSQLGSGWNASKGVYVLPANRAWAAQLMNYTPASLHDLPPQEQEYVKDLMEQYGFKEETARLILKLKKGIDKKYPEMSPKDRDKLLNRALGSPTYDGFKWDQTAGGLPGDSPQEFFRNAGLTDAEAQLLFYEIKKQNDFSALDSGETVDPAADKSRYAERLELYKATHNTKGMSDAEIKAAFLRDWKDQNERYAGKTDFAHQSITTAANLNESWNLARFGLFGKKNRDEIAGWRGDATRDAETKPSMGNDDYKADLDAVNITTIMKKKKLSYVEASNYYYNHLENDPNPKTSKQTRAELFLQSTDMNHVKNALYDMVPPKSEFVSHKVGFRSVEPTEKEKRAFLKKQYPDSYNFLRSLEERDGQMGNYAESE